MSEYTHRSQPGSIIGRWTDLAAGRREVRALETGMDFREPQYRREVFLRFYEFHLRYRTHPGCVYMLIPYLFPETGDSPRMREDRLWFCFINGLTQHPITSTIIYREFPEVPRGEPAQKRLTQWFNEHWDRLPFDTDRRYQKKLFPGAVAAYAKWLDGLSQASAWSYRIADLTPEESFDRCWETCQKHLVSLGRLSTWSFLEYLFIAGLPLEPSSMMLRDMSGSKSHRNGLAVVLGRDDLDWRKDSEFKGVYSKEVVAWLEWECDQLLVEMRDRCYTHNQHNHQPWFHHISRFTLESALCTYKGWYRPNRRYPNVYADMMRDRIDHVQRLWPDEDLGVFWEARQALLPTHLRVEDSPGDPGLARLKQNHYRLTGQVIMMDQDWAVFKNDESWREKT